MEKKIDTEAKNGIRTAFSLSEIYNNSINQIDDELIPKYLLISRRFEEIYGEKPDLFSRAPGIINLLGEAGSENGYPIISLGIENDIIIAFKETNESYLELHNFIENMYKHLKLVIKKDMKLLENTDDKWANPIIIALNHIISSFTNISLTKGIKILVFPILPENSLLSFDTAMTICSELVFISVYKLQEKCIKENLIIDKNYIVPLFSEKNKLVLYQNYTPKSSEIQEKLIKPTLINFPEKYFFSY